MRITHGKGNSRLKSTQIDAKSSYVLEIQPSLFMMLLPSSGFRQRNSDQLLSSLSLFIICLTHLPRVQAQTNVVNLNTVTSYGGAEALDGSGRRVSFAGDVDGDGHIDILVAEPNASPLVDELFRRRRSLTPRNLAGRVRLVYGPIDSGITDNFDFFNFTQTENVVFIGSEAGTQLGDAVSVVGDVDGDGYDDVIFSDHDNGYSSYRNAGHVYLWFGRPRNATQAEYDLSIGPSALGR